MVGYNDTGNHIGPDNNADNYDNQPDNSPTATRNNKSHDPAIAGTLDNCEDHRY